MDLQKELDNRAFYEYQIMEYQEEIGELNEKLREVAKIAFQTGGGKERGRMQRIKHLVWDWREK